MSEQQNGEFYKKYLLFMWYMPKAKRRCGSCPVIILNHKNYYNRYLYEVQNSKVRQNIVNSFPSPLDLNHSNALDWEIKY